MKVWFFRDKQGVHLKMFEDGRHIEIGGTKGNIHLSFGNRYLKIQDPIWRKQKVEVFVKSLQNVSTEITKDEFYLRLEALEIDLDKFRRGSLDNEYIRTGAKCQDEKLTEAELKEYINENIQEPFEVYSQEPIDETPF
jgi:hypothetical protein